MGIRAKQRWGFRVVENETCDIKTQWFQRQWEKGRSYLVAKSSTGRGKTFYPKTVPSGPFPRPWKDSPWYLAPGLCLGARRPVPFLKEMFLSQYVGNSGLLLN